MSLLTTSDKRWLLGATGVGLVGLLMAGPIGAIAGAVGVFGVHKALGARAAASSNAAANAQLAADRARAASQGKK
jgi:hypothetical protein